MELRAESDDGRFVLEREVTVYGNGREIRNPRLRQAAPPRDLLDLRGTLWDCVAAAFAPGSSLATLDLVHQGDDRRLALSVDCASGVAWERAAGSSATGGPLADYQRRLGPAGPASPAQALAALRADLEHREWASWLAHEVQVLEAFVAAVEGRTSIAGAASTLRSLASRRPAGWEASG